MASKIDTQTIENHLSTLGKKNSKGKIYFGRVLFDTKITKIGIEIILDSPDTQKIVRDFKGEMVKSLKAKFKNLITVTDKPLPGTRQKIVRLRYSDKGSMKFVDFEIREYPTAAKSGALDAKISEPATMLVLNAALESKGKIFRDEEDIFVDDVYGDLEKLFGKKYGAKLDEWIYTFLTQNKLFFENYGKAKWSKFKHKDYGERDMQVFFNEHLKNLTLAPGVSAGRNYTQWNPADIWAVKTTDQKTLEKEIESETKSPKADNLIKLNDHLVRLMEKNELIGISLKKIDSGGTFKLYNVDNSKLLTNLKGFKKLEKFDMKDIHFELKNVFANFPGRTKNEIAATNYIMYGDKDQKRSKFKISITRSDMAIVFNTSIPSDSGAQGGQTLKGSVLELLRKNSSGVTFNNSFLDYPKTANDFTDIVQKNDQKIKTYEKWFNFVYKHPKNNYKNGIDFETWADGIYKAYDIREKKGYGIAGVTKLSLLNFWYDALKNHDDDPDFWTDILYFGLKITTKGQFGPHAKIS